MPEKKRSSDEAGMTKLCPCCLFDGGGFKQKRTPFIVITLSGLAGPVLAAVTTFADLNIGLISSAVMLLVLAITTWYVLLCRGTATCWLCSQCWTHCFLLSSHPVYFKACVPQGYILCEHFYVAY